VRNEEDADRLRTIGAKIKPVLLDVTDDASIRAALCEVASDDAPLVGVVANAGIALGGPLEYFPVEELRRQFEVNVFGAMALVQAALPQLPSPNGRVVFVGSISGRIAMPYAAPYSASKFALRAIADALRLELAPAGISVSLIEPGAVNTPIWRKGRESRDGIAAMLGSDARPHYYRVLERIVEGTKTQERVGIPAERVAEAILHALTAARPRRSYLLGSAMGGSIIALLPAAMRESILRRMQG
jgi:NAD(P)-dependent dehydrogenase (short-subunit alcohol dehydrogenase family)